MGRVLVYVVPVALAIYALIDLWRSRPAERAGLHPALWVLIIVLLPVLGPASWILTSIYLRSQQRAVGGGPTRPSSGTARPGRPMPRRRPGPVAPDDDPDFLWRLERERRRREPGGGGGAGGPAGTSEPGPPGGPGGVTDGPPPDEDGPDGDGPTGRGSGRDAGAGKDDDGRG